MLKSSIQSFAAYGVALPLALGAALAAAAAPVAAAPLAITEIVTFEDLDLTHPRGHETLKRRTANAIQRVCGRSGPMSMQERDDLRACVHAARADADAQIERAVRVALLTRGRPLTTAQR